MNFSSKWMLSLASLLVANSLMGAPDPEVMKRGEAIYNRTCIACHQANGQGIDPVFPPLAGSEWVAKNPSVIVRNILHGAAGPITVKGKVYNGMMPAVAGVSDAEIADVSTFVRNSWGNAASVVTEDEVKAIKAKYADRKTPWTAEELDKDSK
jgi:mono/diheme cytochrome c family protein